MNNPVVDDRPKRRKWTDEELLLEALKYETKNSFRRGSPAAFQAVKGRKLLPLACLHMREVQTRWTLELAELEAKKYKSRAVFAAECKEAYEWARTNGLLDEVCSHMTRYRKDQTMIYIWRPKNHAYYKIGTTSTEVGIERIKQVARRLGVEPEIIVLATTTIKARLVERQLLQLGVPVSFQVPFFGHTEFRWMGPEELSQAVKIVANNSWLNSNNPKGYHGTNTV